MKILIALGLSLMVVGCFASTPTYTQEDMDAATRRAGKLAYQKAYEETEKRHTQLLMDQGMSEVEARAIAKEEADRQGTAARRVAEAMAREMFEKAERDRLEGGVFGKLMSLVGVGLTNLALGWLETKTRRS